MSKNEIILRNPKQGALVKANKQSQTFLTLLQQSDEQRLIELLKTIYAADATVLISGLEHIKWTAQFIEKYAEYWYFGRLSGNKALPWSIGLIERFEDRWVWRRLSENEALPWSIDLLEKFKYKWYWLDLAFNEKVQQIFTALSVQGIEEVMDYHIEKLS